MSLVRCPGSEQRPSTDAANQPTGDVIEAGRPREGICSRCASWRRLRADGRIGVHKVEQRDIVPMIRGALDPHGRLRGRRA